MIYRMAAGFNHACENRALNYHADVGLIEMGLPELTSLQSDSLSCQGAISLHLSRVPIIEDDHIQDQFVKHVKALLKKCPATVRNKIISIGVHLTGSRYQGIGRLGNADGYVANETAEQQAIRFIKVFSKLTSLPIWLENANIYSKNSKDLLFAWQSANRIARESNAGLIIDLAHLVGECYNLQLDPHIVLGSISWNQVAELHLSGIREGLDGTMHDGHSLAVHEKVWSLLSTVLRLTVASTAKTVWLNIEHTPPSWAEKVDLYIADFDRLSRVLASFQEEILFTPDINKYMINYLKYVLRGRIPLLEVALSQRGLNFDALLIDWIAIMNRENKRIIFDDLEVAPEEIKFSSVLTHGFLEHCKKEMRLVEAKYAN